MLKPYEWSLTFAMVERFEYEIGNAKWFIGLYL